MRPLNFWRKPWARRTRASRSCWPRWGFRKRISQLTGEVRGLTKERARILPFCSDPKPKGITAALAHAVRVLRDVRRWDGEERAGITRRELLATLEEVLGQGGGK